MGTLYLLFAIEAGVDGTLFSMRVRIELALPFVSRVYNVIITAHAFLMIFFLIMPALLGGFSNLLVPIQIGAAEMALPRLNAISFMLLPPSLLLLLSSFFDLILLSPEFCPSGGRRWCWVDRLPAAQQ